MARIAINGFGRIGRAAFKLIMERPELEVVAINDLAPGNNLAYLLKYDTVYGRYGKPVSADDETLVVGDLRTRILHERDPRALPWRELGVDVVLECTGKFRDTASLAKHLEAGARAAILSAPSKDREMATVVPGVNRAENQAEGAIISCASCTTNSIAPVMEVLVRRIGVDKAMLTTVHAYTSSQAIVDSPAKSLRRGRAGAMNFVPASTGAAVAAAKAVPELEGRFDGIAIRGPVPVGSVADIVLIASRPTSVDEINAVLREEALTERYRDVLAVTDDEIASSDVIGDPHASIVDLTMTRVVDGTLVKVMAWYDNEWGYANQLVRQAAEVAGNLPVAR